MVYAHSAATAHAGAGMAAEHRFPAQYRKGGLGGGACGAFRRAGGYGGGGAFQERVADHHRPGTQTRR